MNKTCSNKQISISSQNHAQQIVNKTRYDDSGKLMKQTSFTQKIRSLVKGLQIDKSISKSNSAFLNL